jgi:hypothetical protein
MRPFVLSVICLLILNLPARGQQATSSVNQAATLLSQSFAALTGSVQVSDVTLTGAAQRTAGSDDENGTATYKAVSGANRLDMSLSSGLWSEIRNGGSGTWQGPDAVTHSMADHNLITDVGWFPAFTLAGLLSSTNEKFTYVGQETKNGVSVIHIRAWQQPPNLPSDVAGELNHLSEVDLYLDAITLRPFSYMFNSHPDDDALIDLPTEIRYSNYQNINGVFVPLHVQKFVNESLTIDLQFNNATFNNGISATQINAQ